MYANKLSKIQQQNEQDWTPKEFAVGDTKRVSMAANINQKIDSAFDIFDAKKLLP